VAADWCSQFHFTTVKPGVLTVATYGTGIPDVIINPDKTMTGLEGGMFDQFVKDCKLKMELFETTFASMILAVKEGKADIGTYIFWNEDRSKQVFYTFPHWVADHTQVFTRADFPYTDASSLADKKVGTVTGFVWAGPIQQTLGGKATLFPDAVTGGTALMNGQIDGWINGGTTIQNPPFDTKPGTIVGHDIKGGDFGIPEVLVTNKSYNITNCNNKDLAKAMSQNIANMVYTGAWAKILTDNKVSLDEGPTLEEPQQGC
jgi:polar amino acid transport system substrate-binding protein